MRLIQVTSIILMNLIKITKEEYVKQNGMKSFGKRGSKYNYFDSVNINEKRIEMKKIS